MSDLDLSGLTIETSVFVDEVNYIETSYKELMIVKLFGAKRVFSSESLELTFYFYNDNSYLTSITELN